MRKKLLIAFGVLLGAGVLIELLLCASGQLILFLGSAPLSTGRAASKTILCVGDSHTFGLGTLYQYSYPAQLKALCDRNNPCRPYRIINAGVPGSSTRKQVDHLVALLDRERVDVVLFLTGRNNVLDLEAWQNSSPASQLIYPVKESKLYRLLRYIVSRFYRPQNGASSGKDAESRKKEDEYLDFHLERALTACKKHGAIMVLLSYYNSSPVAVRAFASSHRIPYLDLQSVFEEQVPIERLRPLLSSDRSHLNSRGYKVFSEAVYSRLFLQVPRLLLRPLVSKLDAAAFCRDKTEVYAAIKWQESRAHARSRNPFEMTQLGEAYMEAGELEKARQCFRESMEKSNCRDNNTLTTPLITWYYSQGRFREAYETCVWILSRNKNNSTAARYKEYLEKEYPGLIRTPPAQKQVF